MIAEIRLDGVEKSFGGVHAVAGVSLHLEAPRIYGLIGPNGAGKTTLINLVGGFLTPDAGRCFVAGVETTKMEPHRIARLGIARTFQSVRLVGEMSARENVMLAIPGQTAESPLQAAFGWRWSAEDRRATEYARQILDRVGLPDRSEEPVAELSYGQQKLLSLACCIATGARILLLDEPVAGVHPQQIEEIVKILDDLRREGDLVVLIEHDLATVRRISDSVVVMDAGQIIAHGSPAEVLERQEILEVYVG